MKKNVDHQKTNQVLKQTGEWEEKNKQDHRQLV